MPYKGLNHNVNFITNLLLSPVIKEFDNRSALDEVTGYCTDQWRALLRYRVECWNTTHRIEFVHELSNVIGFLTLVRLPFPSLFHLFMVAVCNRADHYIFAL